MNRIRQLLLRLWRNEDANIALTFALILPVLLGFGALAVDEISLYQERRLAQSAVDLAAITAARDPERAGVIVREVLQAHGLETSTDPAGSGQVQVIPGTYIADPDLAPAERFDQDGAHINAVQVTYRQTGTLFFAGWWSRPPQISVAATATTVPEVAFSVGSRLASLHGGVLNAVLGDLLGTSLSLDLMSYEALASAEIDLFRMLDALAMEMDVDAVTYDEVLASRIEGAALARALEALLADDAAHAAGLIADAVPAQSLDLRRLFDLGRYGSITLGTAPSGLAAGISALEMLLAAAAVSDGTGQVALDLGLGVPGIATTTVRLAIGAPPAHAWFVLGQRSAVARTAQLRLQLAVRLLGNPATGNGSINLPIYTEMAYAEARVGRASCPTLSSPNGSADIDTRPGIVRVAVGEAADESFAVFNAPPQLRPADVLNLPLVRVTGSAALDVGALHPERLRFSSTDIANARVHTAATDTALQSAVSSLMRNLDLRVETLGLGLGTALIGPAIERLIAPVTPALDNLINVLLQTLGLSLGEADVRVYKVLCTRSVLVG